MLARCTAVPDSVHDHRRPRNDFHRDLAHHADLVDQRIAYEILGRSGGALVTIGAVPAVMQHVDWRIIIGASLAVFGAALAGVHSTGYLAGTYIVAAIVWWGHHTWRHGASALNRS
jgi:hypothetical protein